MSCEFVSRVTFLHLAASCAVSRAASCALLSLLLVLRLALPLAPRLPLLLAPRPMLHLAPLLCASCIAYGAAFRAKNGVDTFHDHLRASPHKGGARG